MSELTLERVKELVSYDPVTGVFTSLVSRGPAVKGKPVGAVNAEGYTVISLDGRRVKAGRLAWFYMTGKWPEALIDHRNTKRNDDSWRNLRPATRKQNAVNFQTTRDLPRGVSPKGRKFQAAIRTEGKMANLGTFNTAEEAHRVFVKRHIELHKEFSPYFENENEKITT